MFYKKKMEVDLFLGGTENCHFFWEEYFWEDSHFQKWEMDRSELYA